MNYPSSTGSPFLPSPHPPYLTHVCTLSLDRPGTHYVVQAGLELAAILLPLPLACLWVLPHHHHHHYHQKKKCLLRTTCFFEEHEHTQNYGMWLLGPRRNPIFMETAPCYLPMAPGCPWVAWGFVPRLSLENCCGLSRLGAQDTATAHQRPEHAGIFVSHSQHTGKTPENQN